MSKSSRKHLILFIISLSLLNWGNFVLAAQTGAVLATIRITVCGNGVIETGEQCDSLGSVLGGATCASRGFSSGTLSCQPSCEFNTSACISAPSCGNGSCSSSETCSSCPANCGTCPSSGGGGGGGGGGSYTAPVTSVVFSGRAYPKSAVTLLKDAQVAATTIAGADASFSISVAGLAGGNYIFSVYSEDNKGIRSFLLSFPVSVTSGATTNVTGIFISPTIAVDKSEVKRGDNVVIFGQSVPNSEITISVNSDEEFFNKIKTDTSGAYLLNFDTSPLEIGQHNTKSKVALNGEISSFSKVIGFAVGTKNVLAQLPTKAPAKGDSNGDNKVNLVDFSVSAYWYKRPSPPASVDLNGDKKVDLIDFSIMAFYWTG